MSNHFGCDGVEHSAHLPHNFPVSGNVSMTTQARWQGEKLVSTSLHRASTSSSAGMATGASSSEALAEAATCSIASSASSGTPTHPSPQLRNRRKCSLLWKCTMSNHFGCEDVEHSAHFPHRFPVAGNVSMTTQARWQGEKLASISLHRTSRGEQ